MIIEESEAEQYNELSHYTLGHSNTIYFIHQHFVDAYMAQKANENTKPIGNHLRIGWALFTN